jgi:hypothetical protein
MQIIDWADQGVIPGLLFFQNGGEYTGSVNDFSNKMTKEFRYRIDSGEKIIKAMVWYGPYCYDKSEIVDQKEFMVSRDGRSELLVWLKEKYEIMIE